MFASFDWVYVERAPNRRSPIRKRKCGQFSWNGSNIYVFPTWAAGYVIHVYCRTEWRNFERWKSIESFSCTHLISTGKRGSLINLVFTTPDSSLPSVHCKFSCSSIAILVSLKPLIYYFSSSSFQVGGPKLGIFTISRNTR